MNKKIGLSLLMLSLVSLVSADAGDYSWMGSMMGGYCGAGGMGFGWLIMVLVVVVLILLVIWLSKQIWGGNGKRRK